MAWVALWWKVAGYAPVVTRSAMLVVAAFSLLGVFRLAGDVANTQVAIASTLCTALYPVFFTQSSLAQVDLAAAGLTFWGLTAYLEERPRATASGSLWPCWPKRLQFSRRWLWWLGGSAFLSRQRRDGFVSYGSSLLLS